MWSSFYQGNELVSLALVALVFFVAFFAGVVVYTFGRRREARDDALASMPLSDDSAPAHELAPTPASVRNVP